MTEDVIGRSDVERVSTGIMGMDELLNGGIPRNNLVLLSGGSGTGKSTFGIQFLREGALNGESGILVALDERLEKIRRNARLLGWDLDQLEDEGVLTLLQPDLYEAGESREVASDLGDQVASAAEQADADRVVVDALSSVAIFYGNEFRIRREIVNLGKRFTELDATVLATSEVPEHEDGISRFGVAEFAADGIIKLYYRRKQHANDFRRGVTVRKMRGSTHSSKIRPLDIGQGGISVYPNEEAFSEF